MEDRHPDGALPLRLLFVGKDSYRKGLDRLLRAFAIARRGGFCGTLTVVGNDPPFKNVGDVSLDGVEVLGVIDKATQMSRFASVVSSCDIGCLLSRAEAAGIGIREYQAFGLCCFHTDVGGLPEQVFPGAGVMVARTSSDQEIADVMLHLGRTPEYVAKLKGAAWANRRSALWSNGTIKIASVLNGDEGRAFARS
jgi:glycosyltransferase involved in cell wall biosynthesis